ncbi:hypothetical protein ACFRJ8_19150 [Arthrobacter sp. NPDC056886]
MDAFVHGLQELSDNDMLVLGAVIEELRHTSRHSLFDGVEH